MWHVITKAATEVPSDRNVRLAVIHGEEVHALVFPCRKTDAGWIHAGTRRIVEVFPTHWQYWEDSSADAPTDPHMVGAAH